MINTAHTYRTPDVHNVISHAHRRPQIREGSKDPYPRSELYLFRSMTTIDEYNLITLRRVHFTTPLEDDDTYLTICRFWSSPLDRSYKSHIVAETAYISESKHRPPTYLTSEIRSMIKKIWKRGAQFNIRDYISHHPPLIDHFPGAPFPDVEAKNVPSKAELPRPPKDKNTKNILDLEMDIADATRERYHPRPQKHEPS